MKLSKELTLERSSKDFYRRQNIMITLETECIEIPIEILRDFVNDEYIKKSYVPFPEE